VDRLEHLQEGIDFNFSNNSSHDYSISEVQRQLASSLLALANDDPAQSLSDKNKGYTILSNFGNFS
jgi:hypothetical protein